MHISMRYALKDINLVCLTSRPQCSRRPKRLPEGRFPAGARLAIAHCHGARCGSDVECVGRERPSLLAVRAGLDTAAAARCGLCGPGGGRGARARLQAPLLLGGVVLLLDTAYELAPFAQRLGNCRAGYRSR
jgi:hypothetical protein